jgi:hypothetical protein
MMWLWASLGCGGYSGEWVAFPDTPPTALEARFRGADAFTPTPEQAFDVRGRCPRIRRARVTPESEGVWALELDGDGFDRVSRVEALLPNRRLAEIRFAPPSPTLLVPIACADCEVVLGVDVGGHPVGCKGPGRSVRVVDGRPTSPAAP